MGLFDFFSSKKRKQDADVMAWAGVVATLTGTLLELIHEHPAMLADPYARVVLSDSWHPAIATGKPASKDVIGVNDVAYVFLRENEEALQSWVKSLVGLNSAPFAHALTQQFASMLVNKLKEKVDVV